MTHSNASLKAAGERGGKPFPWRCAHCRRKEVNPATIAYRVEVPYEGTLHAVELPDLRVARCGYCGELAFGNDASDRISEAIRRHLGLLTGEQIRRGREVLGLTVEELDKYLGLNLESVAEFEAGLKVQSRALDRYLRAFFAVPQLRAVLSDTAQSPHFGCLTGA